LKYQVRRFKVGKHKVPVGNGKLVKALAQGDAEKWVRKRFRDQRGSSKTSFYLVGPTLVIGAGAEDSDCRGRERMKLENK